jgi:hypothetical protein
MSSRQRRWVVLAFLVVVVGFSVQAYRSVKGDWLFALIPGLVAGGALIDSKWFQNFWKALALRWKVGSVCAVSGVFLLIPFLINLHKPDARFENLVSVIFLSFLLLLWALYSLMSCGLDALWFWIKRRRNSL